MNRIFVTRPLPGNAVEILRKECEVEVRESETIPTKEELIEGVREKDGLLCFLTDKIDSKVMDTSPDLQVIANCAVGYDNIDVRAATERGIMVTNTPGVLTETVADLVWALLLAIARKIPQADKLVRNRKWKGWSPTLMLGSNVYRKTIGIVGLGRIGLAVARRARGFDMDILYTARTRKAEFEKELGATFVSLDELSKKSDYLTLHIPLTPETRHMIGERELSLMKPNTYLINTARGPVVDEKALITALKEKKIAGAALDVFEYEPEVPQELLELDNVVVTPHIGSASFETRSKMARMAAENLLVALREEVPLNLVNKEVLERNGS